MPPIISAKDLRLAADAVRHGKQSVEISLDLGISKQHAAIESGKLLIGEHQVEIPKIRDDDNGCYLLQHGKLAKVQFFSEVTNCFYKLIPTSYRPILQVSGTGMHKLEFVTRIEREKLKGRILDAGTGLGYTAIAASKTADEVTTIELDETVVHITTLNPYSQELFTAKNIKRVEGDVTIEIKRFNGSEFDTIIFDAGTPKSSGEFFSLANYKEAYRVLKKGGKLYHYLPRHHIQRGRDFGLEAINIMKKAGFKLAERNIEGSYAIMEKG